ncbi:MAG: hypothetical protein E7545_08790 [Ruminococcaceae bacterium]|nr:hypothetical protein [Oscillospiraceae bacterium]
MREPYQILSIPYRIVDGTPLYCIFRRADSKYWQFIAGGGENGETPIIKNPKVRDAVLYIEGHYSDSITLSDISAKSE